MHCDAEKAQSTNKTKTTWQLINRINEKPNNTANIREWYENF